jgi:Transposase IS116/IS110/IS902 family./Transposase.
MSSNDTVNCVGIDVSKGKSTIAIMRPLGEIVKVPYEVNHTSSELKMLADTLLNLEGETRIIMEYTGKYYLPIARYLNDSGFFVCVVHAKLMHDFANNSIRKIKTDKADAVKIANYGLANWDILKPFSLEDETRLLLKALNRQYNKYMKQYVASKNSFISLLDQTFPGLNCLFPGNRRPDGRLKWVDVASKFWHSECVSNHSLQYFQKAYNKWCIQNDYRGSDDKAKKIYELASECIPSLPKNDCTKPLIQQAATDLSNTMAALLSTQNEMNRLASSLPEYPVVLAMNGVGTTLGPQLMAEIGDVRRFPKKENLVAFAGVDAPPFQSGKYESRNRHISKRGSSELRKSMFQVIGCLCQHSMSNDPVYQFVARKKAEGKPYYVCMVAGCNKFLRIYYARVKEYLNNLEQQA